MAVVGQWRGDMMLVEGGFKAEGGLFELQAEGLWIIVGVKLEQLTEEIEQETRRLRS